MTEESSLLGRNASNLVGALGEIIAWDALKRMGIFVYKIGSWNFFPEGYPHFRDKKLSFLTRKQAEFVEKKEENQIIEFDFVGVKCKDRFTVTLSKAVTKCVCSEIESVYLIEVKAGRGANIRHYVRNPLRAFSPQNIERAKAIGFKVALVVVELFENWKYRISYREM